jgi:glycosyltransferase involved in cell wall biosynthesis
MLSIFAVPYVVLKRKERPERTVAYEFPLLWAAALVRLLAGGRVELRLTTLPTELAQTFGRFHRFYYRFHELLTWRLVDDFVVVNEATRDYVRALGADSARIRIQAPDTIARDAVHIRAVAKGAARARLGIAEGTPMVLSVGRLEVEKGYPELLELFAINMPDARLVLVGEGAMHAELEAKVASLGIQDRVIFAGWQDRKDIWNFYADADAFVLLSHSESLGMVFWEAMYMNVPVIGRPVGGIPETIGKDGERGFLWDTKDGVDAFAERLKKAIEKGHETREMIVRAKKWVDAKIGATVVD